MDDDGIDRAEAFLDEQRSADRAAWDRIAGAVARTFIPEQAQVEIARATATLWESLADTIAGARSNPWEWVPCPAGQEHLDRATVTQRGFAERAVVADLAVRLHLPEATVRAHAHLAEGGRQRLPELWSRFADGTVTDRHVRIALDAASALDADALARFDRVVADLAVEVSAARFAPRVRLVAERLDPASLTERHRDAVEKRGVWIEQEHDGMAWLTAHLDGFTAAKIRAGLDAAAADLAGADDEVRTRDQLRADVLADRLTGGADPHHVTASVAVTVPVLTLLGRSDRPATLDGFTPIDAETARRIAAVAPSFFRVLTDPVSSTVLDVDRRSYRPPADLARYVRHRDLECTQPGCGRPAASCDLDHLSAWAGGGSTSAANLHAVCSSHHRMRHQTRWTAARAPEQRGARQVRGRVVWTSPSGVRVRPDPPPF